MRSVVKSVDDKEIELKIDGKLKAKQETMLTFTFKNAKTKEPITDLQPYLGAVGHVVILDKDSKQYVHVHPMVEDAKGPEAVFHATFPSPGIYKVWGEFKQNNKVFTVPFVVEVSE
ncbi:hypothetical protein CN324_15150 [Bacillus anthracis]|uniref:hypothetical protein n=1 Tax=Bacillus TaxID=1386 RepID=UPI000BED36B2|nr:MULTISPECIES: hypothetical protein [Bacillus]PED57414.1 hypothetical protein CON50_00430 [Bacillus anthracis]MDE7552966.1 hypothetical protein [Bacillus tropicus]MDE7574021.1 hypothetical protein [Bacillus tropicus]PEF62597.1 hypothetical protein CON33_28140 [Bacillus anthracis]PET34822.1 hypothetical protein CN518_05025 [Bacillus anthracis]